MTVAELIKALQAMPQDAEVTTEGCDCDGDVAKVTDCGSDGVYLERS